MERLNQLWEHRGEGQRAHALDEGGSSRTGQCRELPEGTPILKMHAKISVCLLYLVSAASVLGSFGRTRVTQYSPAGRGDRQMAEEPAPDLILQKI